MFIKTVLYIKMAVITYLTDDNVNATDTKCRL
jgi:hypothetical protein